MPVIPRPSNLSPYPTGSWEYLVGRDLEYSSNGAVGSHEAACKLEVAIVGAGVGGLAAAIALRTAGHNVSVYENALALSEVGAGIQIPPNSAGILHSWGLQQALAQKSVQPDSLFWKRWQDGRIIGHTRYKPDFQRWFGAPYYVMHRAHLHKVLHDKVVELGVPVHLASTVVRYDLNDALFVLESGVEVRADLIVAADGLKSTARRMILGNEDRGLRSHGIAAYRATVPVAKLKADPLVASSVNLESLNLWVGDQTHVMSYSVAGGQTFNLVATVPEPLDPGDWDPKSSVSVEKMRSYFKGWDPALREILSMVTKTSKWPIQDIECSERWTSRSKKLILLGDAAHAMIPFMSIGAAMAVEDACALAQSLKLMSAKSQLARAVDVYEEVRRVRVRQVHESSYRHAYTVHLADGPEQRSRDAAMADEVAGVHFIQSPNQWSDPTTQRWAYAYDPARSIRVAWARFDAAFLASKI